MENRVEVVGMRAEFGSVECFLWGGGNLWHCWGEKGVGTTAREAVWFSLVKGNFTSTSARDLFFLRFVVDNIELFVDDLNARQNIISIFRVSV